MNAFEALCKLGSENNWCWNLYCTTCGHATFRYSFLELAKGKNPDDIDWIVDSNTNLQSKLGKVPLEYSLKQRESIHNICVEADIKTIAKECGHLDWLGYLGLVLYHMGDNSESFKKLSSTWAFQLQKMVIQETLTSTILQDISKGKSLLTVKVLEFCERDMDDRMLY